MRSSFFCSSTHSYSRRLFSFNCLSLMVTTLEYKTIWFMCLTSSSSSSNFFWAFDNKVSALLVSAFYHSVGLTLEALWLSISIIFCFLAFDLARAYYFYSSMIFFSYILASLVLITVACLILSISPWVIMTASFYLLFWVLVLIVLSSSNETTVAPAPLVAPFLPPKRVSSTYESAFLDLWLAREPICD